MKQFFQVLIISLFTVTMYGQQHTLYQNPPQPIYDLFNAPPTPGVAIDREGKMMVYLEQYPYRSIEDLSQPELRLGGLRFSPNTFSSSRRGYVITLQVENIENGQKKQVTGLPKNAKLSSFIWSPDQSKLAFFNTTTKGVQAWILDVQSAKAQKVSDDYVNDVIGNSMVFNPSGDKLLLTLRENLKKPETPLAPEGPTIQEATGEKAPNRTYQDLLKNRYDEELFTYYTTSSIYEVDIKTGNKKQVLESGVWSSMSFSPDGQYLLTNRIKKPYSYLVTYGRFAQEMVVYDFRGKKIYEVADIPATEKIPIAFGSVRTGRRSVSWRPDQPATLYWVEAQDGGDAGVDAEVRDQMYWLKAPFTDDPTPSLTFGLRYSGVMWAHDELAVCIEYWWKTRQVITSSFNPQKPSTKKTLFDYSWEDAYNNPGNFMTETNEYNRSVLKLGPNNTLYLTGQGASEKGNIPFLATFDLTTEKRNKVWESAAPYYEYIVRALDPENGKLIISRQSVEKPSNYFLLNGFKDKGKPLTEFENPYKALEGVEKQVVKYKRADGIQLQGELYLPAGYDPEKDGKLPVLMWAYPDEFKSKEAASQVQGSPYEFIRLGWYSPIYWVTRGYAVFDDISMPIVGEGDLEPNDHFIPQLVANAEAAINILDEMGVGDKNRVAIGGHSYGAFMTANLLAHSNLFAAGIARSGAYNRTLTPFGFQSEERTYWEAPEIYYNMSPFMHADKIKTPFLLIHGEADNNSGTYPMQSERLFNAIKGLGGVCRLVMLPKESHSYQASESLNHMLWEMDTWLEKYVKNKK